MFLTIALKCSSPDHDVTVSRAVGRILLGWVRAPEA